ncbi:MAG: hypothetical protein QOI02_136 [Actinomycetota bacterium]|nr:hypothetical protein [Actinomycetota bacterium]
MRNAIGFGVRDLRSQAGRYVLAAVTMLIGVLGIVAVALTSSIGTDLLVAQQEQLNGRQVGFATQVQVSAEQLDSSLTEQGSLHALIEGLTQRVGNSGASVGVQAESTLTVLAPNDLRARGAGQSIDTRWLTGAMGDLQRLPVVVGTYPAPSLYPLTIALNQAAVDATGFVVGTTVVLRDPNSGETAHFRVSGEVADGQSEPRSYGQLVAAQSFLPSTILSGPVSIRVRTGKTNLAAVNDMLTEVLAQHHFTPLAETRRTDTVDSVREQLQFFQTVFEACAVLILLIAAIGTANVGIASVAERSRELVIRRAIGARRRDIFAQVMWASVGVGVIVSALAVAAAIAATYLLIPRMIPVSTSIASPTFPLAACGYAVAVALLTSIVGGALPALKASRLPVALALRE